MTSTTDAVAKLIDTIGPGEDIVLDGEAYGVVNRCSEGVNVVAHKTGEWQTIPFGTSVLPLTA